MDQRTFENIQRLYGLFSPGMLETFETAAKIQRSVGPILNFLASQYPPPAPAPSRLKERPIWSVEIDPNIPAQFKEVYLDILGANRSSKSFTLQVCACWAYLELARIHYENPELGPVTKGRVWKETLKLYVDYWQKKHGKDYQGKLPSHRARILNSVGLGSLQEEPSGRPAGKW